MKTYLYQHFDSAGTLLYVGVSQNVAARNAYHRTQSEWFNRSAKLLVTPFNSLEAALRAEAECILQDKPTHNRRGPGIPMFRRKRNSVFLRDSKNRARLSVDLTPYPEVERMLVRALQQNPGTKPTYWLVQSLRTHLAAEGYSRKRDSAK